MKQKAVQNNNNKTKSKRVHKNMLCIENLNQYRCYLRTPHIGERHTILASY